MRRYAVPCIISLLVGALYNIVDQIFIANASYLGSYGNEANTVVFPLTVVALAGAVINMILDPIFIFAFRWGMMGAAVATVIGQVATALLAVWYLLHMRIIKPEKGDYRLRAPVCGKTLALGITSFLSQISLVAIFLIAGTNKELNKKGARAQ